MPAIGGITISVGQWYADLLKITLVRNMRHLTECVVGTAPGDPSIDVAREVPGVRLHVTDAFTRPDANGVRPRFNKSLAVEECFDVLGRRGWFLIWDADILLPPSVPFGTVRPGYLYGAKRRMLEDPSKWTEDLCWSGLPLNRDGGPIGFFQLAHADDPVLKDRRPWYDVSFAHGGGGDAYYMSLWPQGKRAMLPVEVLHLGPCDLNWFGADEEGRAMMAKFVNNNGWQRAMAKHPREAAERAGELVERVEVPGFPKSNFELPFVRRAQQARGQGR